MLEKKRNKLLRDGLNRNMREVRMRNINIIENNDFKISINFIKINNYLNLRL